MFRNRWLMLIGVIVVVGVLVWGWRRGGNAGGVDLIPLLPQAEKRSAPVPAEQAIKVIDATLNGEAKACILEQGFGRIEFKLTVPPDAWFSASIGVDPAAWDKEGDGVLFRMAVVSGSGTQYEELLNQHVNPAANASDRRWIPVAVDLSAYAGRDVRIQLSTNPSLPGKPTDLRNDLGLWGAPLITVGR
jgi:hypothetical protein